MPDEPLATEAAAPLDGVRVEPVAEAAPKLWRIAQSD